MTSLPGWMTPNQRTVKGPTNPMDKATIVSIFPKDIEEVKVTLEPGLFKIPAGSYEKPVALVVGSSSWWREIDEQQPLLEIPVSAIQVAHSVVTDYAKGLLDCDMAERMPGLFYVPGSFTIKELLANEKSKAIIELANHKQKNWFSQLVKTADVLWSRTNGNPLAVPELSRIAARELNYVDKEWLKDSHTLELVKCVACQALINKSVIICPNCKVIVDQKKFKEMNLQFANTGV